MLLLSVLLDESLICAPHNIKNPHALLARVVASERLLASARIASWRTKWGSTLLQNRHCANNGCMNEVVHCLWNSILPYSAGCWLIGSEEICGRVSFTYPGSDAGSSVVESPDARQLHRPRSINHGCVFAPLSFDLCTFVTIPQKPHGFRDYDKVVDWSGGKQPVPRGHPEQPSLGNSIHLYSIVRINPSCLVEMRLLWLPADVVCEEACGGIYLEEL